MRNTGKTFRVLLQAIYLTSSLSDDKRGVVLYAHNRDYCKELFKKCIGMINVYGGWKYEFYSKDMTIRFPNDKTLSFKSMQEPKEKSMVLIGHYMMSYQTIIYLEITQFFMKQCMKERLEESEGKNNDISRTNGKL